MPEDVQLETLLNLVQQKCTIAQLKPLLKGAKEQDRSILYGVRKEELVKTQLRAALARNLVSTAEVETVLADAEEHGHQHVFLLRLQSNGDLDRYADAEAVASRIFGREDWKAHHGLPRFELKPTGYVYSSFRYGEDEVQNGVSWVLRIYGGVTRDVRRRTLQQGPELLPNEYAVVYEKTTAREVLLACFRSSGVLELRVPEGSRKEVLSSLESLVGLLNDGYRSNDFKRVNLDDAKLRLIERDDEDKSYTLGSILFGGADQGTTRMSPPDEQTPVRSEPARAEASRLFNECRELTVFWHGLGDEDEDNQKRLKTIIGKYAAHELFFPTKANGVGAADVITRLLQAEREASGVE